MAIFSSCGNDDKEKEEPKPRPIPKTEVQFSFLISPQIFSAGVHLTLQPNKTVSEVGILWADHAEVTVFDKKVGKLPYRNFISYTRLDSLIPGQSYYVKGYSIINDTTFFSSEVSFKTDVPKITSIEPAITGRFGRVRISGAGFPQDTSKVKVFIAGVECKITEIHYEQMTILVSKGVPLGEEKKVTAVFADKYSIEADTKIAIDHFTKLKPLNRSSQMYDRYYAQGNIYHIVMGSFAKYDHLQDTWIDEENEFETTMFSESQSFVINNKVFLGVGSTSFSEYIGRSKTLVPKTPLGGESIFYGRGASFAIGGKGYSGFGYYRENGVSIERKKIYSYDPATDNWTEESECPLPEALILPASFTIGNEAFFCSGYVLKGSDGFNVNFKREFWSYNVVSKAWTKYPDYQGPTRLLISGVAFKGKGYIIAGGEIWVFNFSTNAWSKHSAIIPSWVKEGAFAIATDDGIYIGGTGSDDFYLFNPD